MVRQIKQIVILGVTTLMSNLGFAQIIHKQQVGQLVPDFSLQLLESDSLIKLSDFKGKLIMLDFWAPWCKACISKIPKLDSIQRIYKDKIAIILVNSGDMGTDCKKALKKVEGVLKRNLSLVSVYNDQIASSLFPHIELPHYAMISSELTYLGSPTGKIIDSVFFSRLLANSRTLFEEQEVFYRDKVSYGSGELGLKDISSYSFFKKGKFGSRSLSFSRWHKENQSKIFRGYMMRNLSLLEIIEKSVSIDKISFWEQYIRSKRLIIECDSSKLLYSSHHESESEWQLSNLYTIDIVLPARLARPMIGSALLEAIRINTATKVSIQRRPRKCYIIKPLDKQMTLAIDSGARSKFLSIERFIALVNKGQLAFPVVSNVQFPVMFDIPSDWVLKADLQSLSQFLKSYNLVIEEAVAEIEMLVITDDQ